MTVDAARRGRLVERFGPSAGPWCDALPELVAALTARWGLVVGEPLPGGTSASWRCTARGHPAVLKLCPDLGIAADEARALTAWRTCPQVGRLLDADPSAGALLLAEVPTAPAARFDLPEVAGLLTALRRDVTEPLPALPTLADRVEFVGRLWRRRTGDPALLSLLDRGAARARELVADPPRGLVHGDLHPGNVLRRAPDGLLVAIHPRPCIGDPACDAVDWVLLDLRRAADARDRAERLADLVAGLDADRALAWAGAFAALTAVALLRRGVDDATTRALLALADR